MNYNFLYPIIGESRDGEEWRVVWDGITTPPSNYFKEYIKIRNLTVKSQIKSLKKKNEL